ncbi:MAG: hypothetical protein ACYCSN_01365 [Acidobacteriaceae bacterium]
MSSYLTSTISLTLLAQAEHLLSEWPSLTLLVLSSGLFVVAGLLQRLSRRAPAQPPARTRMVPGKTEQPY